MGVFIIAEAGVNHNGDIQLAKRLVEEAKKAGADCVKFQTFRAEALVTTDGEKADYQKKQTGGEESQLEMLKRLELTREEFLSLREYCDQLGIGFLSTAFDMESLNFLESLNPFCYKIPSGEITNYPYLVAIGKTGRDVILSTGMSEVSEIEEAVKVLTENGAGEITLLHCTTEYPAPIEDVNLRAMQTLAKKFGVKVGYSDHTEGIEVPIAAVAMGATVIEKHFTLDKNMEGPDHKASLEPEELSKMVQAIRKVELALGSSEKQVTTREKSNRKVARKSIVAARDIRVGEVFTEENLTAKRPGDGISPMKWPQILGQKAARSFKKDERIVL